MFNEGAAVLDTDPGKVAVKREVIPQPPAPPPFQMPPVKAGRMVMWKPDPREDNGTEAPALVVRSGDSAISLIVFVPDSQVFYPRDGVRHVSDPRWTSEAGGDSGVWWFGADDMNTALEHASEQIAKHNTFFDDLNAQVAFQSEQMDRIMERISALESKK